MQKRCAEQGGAPLWPGVPIAFCVLQQLQPAEACRKIHGTTKKAGFRPCAKIGLFDASVSAIGGLPGSGAYSVCGPELAIEIAVVGKTAPEGCLLGGDTGVQQLLNVL